MGSGGALVPVVYEHGVDIVSGWSEDGERLCTRRLSDFFFFGILDRDES